MKHVELLSPAGDLTKLKIAILFGADAVFCGGKQFSLRAKANNFSLDDIKEAVKFATFHNARVHITVNIVPEDDDFKNLDAYLLALNEAHVHAIIVSSIYIMKRAKELNCSFEVHVSTQQSIANYKAVSFFKETVKADRVVLARELNINEIEHIKEKSSLPLEVFIHGGMCSSFSGRCTLSNAMSSRDANKGGCAHSCRWIYHLYENDKLIKGSNFIIASSDLMSIDYIPFLLKANVDSFKIEGRMKSIHYVATIVSAYRRLIDEYYKNKAISKARLNYYKNEIKKAENRITSTGFLNERMVHQGLLLNTGVENPTQSFIGLILSPKDKDGYYLMEVRNYFEENDYVEAFTNKGKTISFHIKNMLDEDNNKVVIARHPKQILRVKIKYNLPIDTLIRKK